ncbi:MAG: arsenate reductase ArsC [Gemmatimonadales bacterium]
MPSVVFICVANSARSQMAEGIARTLAPTGWTIHSAGSEPTGLNPYAVTALHEVGIDIRHHKSKGLDSVPLAEAAAVITLCADEQCPVLPPGVKRIAWPLPDPARANGDEIARLEAFRVTREELRSRLGRLWDAQGELNLE